MPNSFMGMDVEKWPIIKSHRRTAGDQTHENVDFSTFRNSTVSDSGYNTTLFRSAMYYFLSFIVPMAINQICTYISIFKYACIYGTCRTWVLTWVYVISPLEVKK